MKKYRFFLSCLLVLSMILSCATSSFAMNAASFTGGKNDLTEEEKAIIEAKMVINEVAGAFIEMEYLYNSDGDAAYILGSSENGYIILGREDFSFHEAGRMNPYVGHEDVKKYYGGVLCYYADALDELKNSSLVTKSASDCEEPVLYDIMRKEFTTEMITLEYRNDADMEMQTDACTRAVSDYVMLPSYYMYIQRKAFGLNNDGTCSAVATGIALNYIARQYGISHANSIGLSENLSAPDTTNILQDYPNANALHRFLDDTCGMGPVSYGYGIANPVNTYENLRGGSPRINISFTVWPTTDNAYAQIKQTINGEMPALITTTIFTHGYDFHTMCVYGARINDGDKQLCVHTGWYGSDILAQVSANAYYHPELWVSAGYASYVYSFSF